MTAILNNFGTIVLYIGMLDAAIVLLMGIVAALLYLFGKEAKVFYDRVVPATLILVATSIAAGVILLAARGIAGWVGG